MTTEKKVIEVLRLPANEVVVIAVCIPIETFDCMVEYSLKKRMIVQEAIVKLAEKGLEAEQ